MTSHYSAVENTGPFLPKDVALVCLDPVESGGCFQHLIYFSSL